MAPVERRMKHAVVTALGPTVVLVGRGRLSRPYIQSMRLLRPILPLVSGLFGALPLASQKAPVRQPPQPAPPKDPPAKPAPAPEGPNAAYLHGILFAHMPCHA